MEQVISPNRNPLSFRRIAFQIVHLFFFTTNSKYSTQDLISRFIDM